MVNELEVNRSLISNHDFILLFMCHHIPCDELFLLHDGDSERLLHLLEECFIHELILYEGVKVRGYRNTLCVNQLFQ